MNNSVELDEDELNSLTENGRVTTAELSKDCYRSAKITLWNECGSTLMLDEINLHQGDWIIEPPTVIQNGTAVQIIVGSRSVFTTAGFWVKYGKLRPHTDPNPPAVFWFEVKVPVSGTTRCDFSNTQPDSFRIFEYQRSEHNSSYVSIAYKIVPVTGQVPLLPEMEFLCEATSFHPYELSMLYSKFLQISNHNATLAVSDWARSIFDNSFLISRIFKAFIDSFQELDIEKPVEFQKTDNRYDSISFPQFICGISIMARGSQQQKLELLWLLLEKDYLVSRDFVELYVEAQASTTIFQDQKGYRSIIGILFGERLKKEDVKPGTPPPLRPLPSVPNAAVIATASSAVPPKPRRPAIAIPTSSPPMNRDHFMRVTSNTPVKDPLFELFDVLEALLITPIETCFNVLRRESAPPSEIVGWLHKDKGESLLNNFVQIMTSSDRRWFVVRGGFMAYYKKETDQNPLFVFSLKSCVIKRRVTNNTIRIQTPEFSRVLYCQNTKELNAWVSVIRSNVHNGARFRSFVPIRSEQRATWFINADQYFQALIPLLAAAKQRIFISGWFFSPGLYLSRKHPLNKDLRLDRLLARKAAEGVKIYILIWNASKLGFDLQASYVTQYMTSLHPNIKCNAHPFTLPFLWSHHQKFVVIDEQAATVGGIDLAFGRYEDSRYLLFDDNGQTYPGRDYNNLNWSIGESNGPTSEIIYERASPRMPWHDVHFACGGTSAADVGRNFIERWNLIGQDYIMPLPEKAKLPVAHYFAAVPNKQSNDCDIQIVRSLSNWSGGLSNTEDSIYAAYMNLILGAKHFIYIENQYFISSIDRSRPQNRILKAIYTRLHTAIKNQENFRVFILLPVYPAGDITSATTQYIVKYTFKTLNRQPISLFETLYRDFPSVDLSQYISVHTLRNYAINGSKAFTEGIYIHAKMMIIDDYTTIIGSANINDRSMCGDRDSELCAIIEQPEKELVTGMLGKQECKVSPFARSLRIELMRNFLGMSKEDAIKQISDPVVDSFYRDIWRAASANNTKQYNSIFKLPDVIYTNESLDLRAYQWIAADYEQRNYLLKIKGFLTDFPFDFLRDNHANLSPTFGSAEYVVPRLVFC